MSRFFRSVGLGLVTAMVLAGCASQEATRAPAGSTPQNAGWVNIGVSPNGNVMHEIDTQSMKRSGNTVQFRDRKTVFNLKRENFGPTPRHKVSLNNWKIDCDQRTYQLLSTALYDENNRLILNHTYGNDSSPAPIVSKSASDQQQQYVCKGAK